MLISPPFLPTTTGAGDDAWVDTVMPAAPGDEGMFPVSRNLGWHGGVHLQAPAADGGYLPVRAIADGQVVYLRQPTPVNKDPDDPLNYDAGQRVSGWTSDGCVIIRHDTEIGDGARGTVRFYSIYMHLGAIAQRLGPGYRIYRKEKVGEPGLVYGKPGQIHFEIICDDGNLEKIVGRSSGDLALDKDGATEVLYGDIHFHLPAGTVFMSDNPLRKRRPNESAPSVAYTATEDLFIGIRYAGAGHVATRQLDGSQVGTTLTEPDFEYDIFKTASALGPQRPSAMLELLRFGRVIGSDMLEPADLPHWRHVNYPGGQGWVNLAPAAIRKFSDADFPHWLGWSLVDDSADGDSRMDSATIKGWLRGNDGDDLTIARAQTALSKPDVQARLRRTICKIPTEWEKASIDRRWGWLKEKSDVIAEPLTDEDFTRLRQHVEKLCFWEDAAGQMDGLSANHWHFHPVEFIKQFRRCGWLSEKEFVQTVPKTVKKLRGTVFKVENIGPNAVITQRMHRWKPFLNRTLRKYNIDRPIRRMYFLANVWEETGYLHLMVEGNGEHAKYAPWYGRGLIQLTHLENYQRYGRYRGFPHALNAGAYAQLGWDPDQRISQDDANCIDTAVYWINPAASALGKNILREADHGYSQDTSVQTARGTNGNVALKNINGLDGRLQAAVYLKYALLDIPLDSATEAMTFAWRRSSVQTGTVIRDGKPHRVFEDGTHTIDVDISLRRPV